MSAIASHRPLPFYRDKWVILLGVPVITAFEYYLTYNNIKLDWLFLYEFISDCLKILVVWLSLRATVIWLDKRYGWDIGLLKRLALQVPLTCLVGCTVLTVLVHLEYWLLRPYPMEHFFSFDLIIAVIFLLLGNLIYISLYYYDCYRLSLADKDMLAQSLQQVKKQQLEAYAVRLGKREILIPYTDIYCFYSEEKETYLLTNEQKIYLTDQSLDRLESQLPEHLFFRANRQFIISPDVVSGFGSEAHGKLAAHLKPSPKLPEQIIISRQKAPAFRSWMKR